MRIGILTFHRSINNGAVMQCYSLTKKLQELFPKDCVEVIDYHMPKIDKFYSVSYRDYFRVKGLKNVLLRAIKLLLDPRKIEWQRMRKRAFEGALEILPLSKQTFYSDTTEQLFEHINKSYDVVIAGSDAIWNFVMRGYPNPYFLSESIGCHKLSYAASCYGMNYEDLPEQQRNSIGKILSTYRFLGIRDDESERFLRTVSCTAEAMHTCDPTVFLDVESLPVNVESIKEKLSAKGFQFDRETIAVMGTEKMCKMIRRMYGKQYQIVALYNRCRNADVNLYDFNPYEWAYVFRLFKITFTTFFHGTLLSLRNGVPVLCIALDTQYSEKHMTKVEDFLRRVGLEDCYFHTDYKKTNFDQIKQKASELIAGDYRDLILERMNQEAQSFNAFVTALTSIKNSEEGGIEND